ncbi:MAG: zinc metalloprotease, partial [Schleiferiaceae bacterium]|nr:zinc metalloprotease [Schleiferiaceae bacterium]
LCTMQKYLILLLFLPLFSLGQRTCGTMTHLENQMLMNPNLEQQMVQDELQLQQFISSTSMAANSIITIPVVVHVVYNNATENISDAQIYSQLDILNEDFRRLNSDTVNTPAMFQSVAADTEIEFCLAVNDPDGNPTTGITRTSTSQSSFSTNDGVKYSASGGVDAWDTDQYLNMWVCDISGGILGYAQFPGGDPTSDGVVCDYEYFGNIGTASAPYDLGRTATHEVGHWLNLRHIWGDSNCGNDFCNDTPEHSGSNYSCPTHPSPSCGNNGDMFMNYMDYTDDACMNIFTNDQKTRMIAAINTQRSGLLTSTACQSPDNGCTDPAALNYSSVAIFDDGSCCYVAGCTDPYAINYDANTCFQDNNTCIYPVLGCDNPNAANYNANANTTSCVGGVLDNNFSSGGYFYGDQHLLLDVYEACVIKSAFFEAEISNTITFELRDANGNVLDDTTHTVSPGMQQLILNFDCPVGTDLQLGTSADNTGLFRNNTGANYPYDIGGALNITESSAGSAGYYYYYYNIEVEIGCIGVAIDSWNCINDACVDPQDGSGTYSSLADCESNCYAPSWNCINDACVDPQDGSGTYSSLADCENDCYAPSWNCINDACVDPQDGSGQFSNLLDCKDVCYPTSWNCINAACVDPQDGSGLYTTLADCENMCTTSAIQSVFKLTDKKVKRIVNALGQEINYQTNTPLFIQYQDGTVEKVIIIE